MNNLTLGSLFSTSGSSRLDVVYTSEIRWIPVKGYENEYLISDRGDVWSIRNRKTLRLKLNPSGYLRVGLSVNGNRSDFFVHRLVAEAFVDNSENKPTVNHLNEKKTDNCFQNLEWATHREQNTYGTRIKRAMNNTDWPTRSLKMDYSEISRKHDYLKMNAHQRKPIYQCDLNGTVIKKHIGVSAAAREIRINAGHLCECLKGRRKTCAGYIWKYVT